MAYLRADYKDPPPAEINTCVSIRKVKKRVWAGMSSQKVVAHYLVAEAEELGYRAKFLSAAAFGQKKNDVMLTVNGSKLSVEVKGMSGPKAAIAMFDKSVRRRNVPQEIDKLAEAFAAIISVGGTTLAQLLEKNSYGRGFLGALDFYKDHMDGAIGLAEDKNSPPSGKIPRDFISKDPRICQAARSIVLANLKDGGDTYFAVHDKSDDSVRFWYTGYGTNILDAPRFPTLKEIALDTYGGASLGATRIALKIRI